MTEDNPDPSTGHAGPLNRQGGASEGDDARALIEEAKEAASALGALVPMMREDAECHRTWTTEAAREDLNRHFSRPAVDLLGDAEWHARWTAFYDAAADSMERVASVVPRLASALEAADRGWLKTSAALAAESEISATRRDALEAATKDRERLAVAEHILDGFKNAPCLRELLGEDNDGCGCMGCASRAYFAARAQDAFAGREEIDDA